MKTKIIQELKNWSENAIMCAELDASGIDSNPCVEILRDLVSQARSAGMSVDEIGGLIWTPYSDEAGVVS